MRPDNLKSFITLLEEADELVRVSTLVDPYLEISTIINRVSKGAARCRALFFEQVKGSEIPLVANLFGSLTRVGWALGTTDLKALVKQFSRDLAETGDEDAHAALAKLVAKPLWLPEPAEAHWLDQDLSAQGLTSLPVLQSWPGDGGRYITLGQVFTLHPEHGPQNCGMYRVQVINPENALIHWRPESGGAMHMQAWHARGKAMPVAIALGGPPVMTWAAGLPLPAGISEADLAGYITGSPLGFAACQTSDLCVPATAEVVIEGTIPPGQTRLEGPFGNHTGRYAPPTEAPVINVLQIYCQEHAVYPCTVVGPPPMEDLFLAKATERLMLPMLQHDYPWVQDVHMPLEGIFHRAAVVSVESSTAGSVRDIAESLWSSILLKNARLLVLVSAGEKLDDPSHVYWRLVNAADWSKHVLLDGSKLVIDARSQPGAAEVKADPAVLHRVLQRWQDYGLN
ncbi:MAG: UbiD family decarboxylase [Deltaproteobacteria bacterium]|jgi:4-hydroxy-3-polyprenylbenzoate decarboxylase|nr:UbiD family decarboxylase [Deltaproteobacteria bacterium]